MFKATAFEYRFRFLIHGLIYLLGFTAPWVYLPFVAQHFALTSDSTLLVLPLSMARVGWLPPFSRTTGNVMIVVALLFTGLGAWLRIWGSAYVGSSVVASRSMHGEAMLADGPYRHTRNPLYLGTLLHTLGIALLMPPSGAIFAVVLLWIFQIRLARAEEPFLLARFGAPYADYAKRVPRFLPMIAAQVPSAGAKPHWLQAVVGELYFVGAFVVLAAFGWDFNSTPLRQGILISLGVWLVARAFLPRAKVATEAA